MEMRISLVAGNIADMQILTPIKFNAETNKQSLNWNRVIKSKGT